MTDNDAGEDISTPEGFEDMLATAFEGMGVPADKAQCLVDRISESVDSGKLSEKAAMSDFFGFFEDCGVDPAEITAN